MIRPETYGGLLTTKISYTVKQNYEKLRQIFCYPVGVKPGPASCEV